METSKKIKDIIPKLSLLKKKIGTQKEFGISVTKEIERKVNDICSLGKGIYRKGVRKGKKKGDLRRARNTARNLDADGYSTDEIAQVLETDTATVQKWLSVPQANPS